MLGILSLTRPHLPVPILAVCDFYYLSETEFQRDSGAQTKHKLKYPPRCNLSNIETICQLRRARNSQQSSHKLEGGREGNLLALLCFRSVHRRNPENTEILCCLSGDSVDTPLQTKPAAREYLAFRLQRR